VPEPLWRLGHVDGPLDFVPWPLCGWQHRWDDPQRKYRTIYCAAEKLTCLREVLADLRPNTKVLAEMADTVGLSAELLRAAGSVTPAWRAGHALAPGRLVVTAAGAAVVDTDDVGVREALTIRHAALLARFGMDHLDISEIRSRTRIVTQTIGRDLCEGGACGVAFGSNLDDRPCFALWEGRAGLGRAGEPLALTPHLPELAQVCGEFGLSLAP
jgi:hypothetical protein